MLSKRPDGFHELETVFYPLPLHDILESVTSSESGFELTGTDLELAPADNLCLRANQLLRNDFPHLPLLKLHLHKLIPVGAGLGGGSADAAFTLMMLNNKYRLGLTSEALQRYALELGSDCPFFMLNTACVARGRGEILTPLNLDLSGYRIVLINPGIHINTGLAFSMITPDTGNLPPAEVVQGPVEKWKYQLVNDFELPVTTRYPVIKHLISQLYEAGATYAAMTGTGSTVYGLFPKLITPDIRLPAGYFVKVLG